MKVQGMHVSWALVGTVELVYWYVWAAYTPLVIGLAKRLPLTGPRFVPHIAIHTIASLTMAPLASVTEYFLSRGLVQSVFRITDPGVLRLLPPFAISVLSMSFTGVLTYWLVVGLYQSIQLSPRIRSQGKTEIQSVAAVSSTNVWAVGGQRLCTFRFSVFRHIGIAARGVLSSLPFSRNHGRQRPFCSRDGCGVAGFCGPVKLICREKLALSTALSSVMSPSTLQL